MEPESLSVQTQEESVYFNNQILDVASLEITGKVIDNIFYKLQSNIGFQAQSHVIRIVFVQMYK